MKGLLIFFVTATAFMSLFSFKSRKAPTVSDSAVLGMILLRETNSLNIDKVVEELEGKWNLSFQEKETDKETSVFRIDNYRILIASMPVPIPGDEVKSTAELNYLWPNGVEEATRHKGHVIVSILGSGKDPVRENILFNQVAASILNNSDAIGVYMGGRTLLLEKDFYLENSLTMSEDDLPLCNWLYFGLRQEGGKYSVYTYGLFDFNKPEMEILNSAHAPEELLDMMFNLTHYVIASNVTLKDGETIGMSATQKLEISYSKGKFLDGKTLKIEY